MQLETDSPSHSPLELRSPSLVPAGTPPHTTHQHTTQPSNATLSSGLCPPVFTAHPGVIPDTDGMAPVDFFRLMFDGDVLNLIFTETNRYASQYLQRERESIWRVTLKLVHMTGRKKNSPSRRLRHFWHCLLRWGFVASQL